MRKNYFVIIIIGILLIIAFVPLLNAQENRAEISFKEEPNYNLVKKMKQNNEIVGWRYNIFITLENNGDKESEEIQINMTDQEGFTLSNITTFEPGETKTIVFSWTTTKSINQKINVNFFPTDLDADWNKYNSGSTSFVLKIDNENGVPAASTPGFEILLFFLSIMTLYIFRKK